MSNLVRGSGNSWGFSAQNYDWDRKAFRPDGDPSRPIFFKKKMLNKATKKLEEFDMVKIVSPGEDKNIFVGKVREEDKMRWPDQWERYQQGLESKEGTPLSQWPECASDIDFIDQMRAFRIYSVEDLANLNDRGVQLFHGALEWREKAKAFLVDQERQRSLESDAAAKQETAAEIAELRAQIAALKGDAPKNKGGRPKKVTEETVAA